MHKCVFSGLAYLLCLLVMTSCQPLTPTLPPPATPTSEVMVETPTLTAPVIAAPETPFVMTEPYPPFLLDFRPRPGEEVSTTTAIEIVFDQPMDRESVVQSFGIDPNVEGSFAWDDASRLTFRPDGLVSETRYQVSLGAEAQSQNGLRVGDEYSFAFSTVSPLLITQVSPQDGATDLRGDTELLLAFNRPVVPMNCTGKDVQAIPECLELPLSVSPSVLGRAEWVNTSLYRFAPISGWGAGQRYDLTLAMGVVGVDGAALRKPFSWSFQTVPPRIETVLPASGAKGIRLESAIRVVFNTPMDRNVTGREFSVIGEEGTVVPGTITWRDNGAELVFTPTKNLTLDSTYTVQIGPRARAQTSAPLENPFAWNFRTVSSPQLIRHMPDVEETSVGVNQPVQLNFAGAIDPESLSENVRISPEPDASHLYTFFDKASNVYTLRWDRQPRTEYCVEVLDNVADSYGHTLGETESFCFVTGDLLPRLELPIPAEMITMNANEPSLLYLGARNVGNVSFLLREFDESTFIGHTPLDGGEILREWTEAFDTEPNQGQLVPLHLRRLRGALPTGLYGLEWQIEGQNYGPHQIGIAVVDHHLTIKLTRNEALVWVADLDSGSPITRTAVRLIDNQGLLIAGGTTDDEGLARIPISPVENLWNRVAAVTGSAGEPGFGIAMTQWFGDASPWNFGLNFASSPSSAYRVFLETDRELYKPEQTLHLYGLVREDLDGAYRVPGSEMRVDITLHDVELQPVYSKTLTLSEFGSFSGSIHLEEMIALGDYTINAEIRSDAYPAVGSSKRIRVEAYRKPPIQVEVLPNSENLRQGEVLQFEVRSAYFSGSAVSNALVDWALSAEPYHLSQSPHMTQPGWHWNDYSGWVSSQVITRGQGVLDELGRLTLKFPADLMSLGDSDEIGSQNWRLRALVTDRSQSPVSNPVVAVGQATIHQSSMYLGLRPRSWMVRARERLEVDVRAVGWDGEPLSDREIKVKLIRRTWSPDVGDNRLESTNDSVVSDADLTTDANGEGLVVFNPPRSGNYVIRAESKDAQGDNMGAEAVLWVSGDDSFAWRSPPDAMTIKLDARTYQVGETAQILVSVPFTTTYQLLFTVERGNLLDVKRLVFDQPNPVIQLPIEDAYAPNVYVSALAVRPGNGDQGADVRAGYANLSVDPAKHLLDVSIDVDRDVYSPGEEARLWVRAFDHSGQPVDAEINLSVVDKAVLESRQTSSEARTIVETFYGEHPLAVSSGHTLLVLINRLADRLEKTVGFELADGPVGLGGADGSFAAVGVRQNFPDTAFWDSTLRTGPDGRVEVLVDLPDSLTTWVVRATAITRETQVGATEREIKVDQPVSIAPVVPEFLVVGDRAEIVAVVHNRTESALDAQIAIEAHGVSVEGSTSQTVLVPAKGRTPVVWALNVFEDALPNAALSFSVDAGDYHDRVALDDAIKIEGWSIPDIRGASGVLSEVGNKVEAFHIPVSATAASALRLRVDTALGAGLVDQVKHLRDDAVGHGSTDGLASRALIALAALQAMDVQNPDTEDIAREAEVVVGEALECIQMRQNPDGGWGWWRDWSNLHMTSYVAMTLIQAESAGFFVPDIVLDRALDYVEAMTARALQTDVRYPHFALAIRVLSQADRPWPSGAATILYRDRDALGVAGRFHLALALGAIDPSDPRVATLLGDLQSEAEISATGAHWEDVSSQYWATDIQVTALAVEAFISLSPDDPLLPQAVRWLMNARQFNRWPTAYETAWVSSSLAAYIKNQGPASGDFNFALSLNGRPLLDDTVRAASSLTSGLEFELRLGSGLQHGLNILEITRQPGEGTLFYASDLHLFLPVDQVSSQTRGISVYRQYCKVSRMRIDDVDARVDSECRPVDKVSVGDTVEVRLTFVVPATRHFVLLKDRFPAGFTPIRSPEPGIDVSSLAISEDVDKSLGVGGGGPLDSGSSGWRDPFDRREYHESQVNFFAHQLPPGTYQVRYRLRAEFPGTYHGLPAVISESYFPEVWGSTEGVTLEIRPAE